MREAAEAVRQQLELPEGWLNDAAKGFVSERHEVTDYDLPQFQHLRVVAPVPEYLLAMKCLASRIGSPGEADDKANIRFLLRQLGLRSPEAALEIAMEYYPPARHSDSREVPARGNFDRGTMKRPASLAEVAAHHSSRKVFGYAVVEFLDQFNIKQDAAMLAQEPPLLITKLHDEGVADAYLAAVAVQMSCTIGRVPPAWTRDAARFLRRPWFASAGPSLRATLLLESPAAFRERNLFVSENALDRA
ncbi:MAG: hypothetical protein H0T95_01210 [Chthoniobacterales bacterium]|nr:hypothetical protein [Chthoniobacterales bacterium]